jgi:ubiquinol-cytochrome c reductase iron-sulfur subunit
MAVLATTRVNLLPTSRALASGVPAAIGLKTALPLQFDHGHGHGGARSDRVPGFVGKDNGIISQTRLNGESRGH